MGGPLRSKYTHHRRYPSILAHAFFCGQYVKLDDPENIPSGMVRSLLPQLRLSCKAFDHEGLNYSFADVRDAINYHARSR